MAQVLKRLYFQKYVKSYSFANLTSRKKRPVAMINALKRGYSTQPVQALTKIRPQMTMEIPVVTKPQTDFLKMTLPRSISSSNLASSIICKYTSTRCESSNDSNNLSYKLAKPRPALPEFYCPVFTVPSTVCRRSYHATHAMLSEECEIDKDKEKVDSRPSTSSASKNMFVTSVLSTCAETKSKQRFVKKVDQSRRKSSKKIQDCPSPCPCPCQNPPMAEKKDPCPSPCEPNLECCCRYQCSSPCACPCSCYPSSCCSCACPRPYSCDSCACSCNTCSCPCPCCSCCPWPGGCAPPGFGCTGLVPVCGSCVVEPKCEPPCCEKCPCPPCGPCGPCCPPCGPCCPCPTCPPCCPWNCPVAQPNPCIGPFRPPHPCDCPYCPLPPPCQPKPKK